MPGVSRVRSRGGKNSQEGTLKVQRDLRKEKTGKEGLGGHGLKETRKGKAGWELGAWGGGRQPTKYI